MKPGLLAAFLLALQSMAFAQLRPPATLYDQFFQMPEAVRPEACAAGDPTRTVASRAGGPLARPALGASQ